MYDELIKRLRTSCESCKLWDGYKCCLKGECSAQTRLQAADAIEELSKPRWIPVTERLPEHEYGESASVLTVDLYGVMRVTYFDGGNWCWPSGETLTTTRVAPITHWMPLPEPPKEKT